MRLIPNNIFVTICLILLLPVIKTYSQINGSFVTVRKNNSECIIDLNNRELIPSGKYANIWTAYDPNNRLFVVTAFNNKKGLWLLGKGEVLPCEYDDLRFVLSYYGFAKKGDKWALLNKDLHPVTGFIFDETSWFIQGNAWVKKNGKYCIIDSTGSILKEVPYDMPGFFGSNDKFKRAMLHNKYGYIDREGNVIIPFDYEGAEQTASGNFFPVQKNGKWGYVNKKNEVVVPFKYDMARSINEGIGLMQDKNFNIIGAINEEGRIIFDEGAYKFIEYANAGKYKVLKNGGWGYIDSADYHEAIAPIFSSCERFYNGIAIVGYKGFSNIIDSTGNILLPQRYESISNWGNILIVGQNHLFGAIDRHGRILLPIKYDAIAYGGHFANIQKGKFWGIVRSDWSILIEPKYDQIRSIDDFNFLAIRDNRSYIVDKNGKETPVE